MGACAGKPQTEKDAGKEPADNTKATSPTKDKEATAATARPAAAPGQKKPVNLLLLGPGESGKSTFFKQLKIIQENGISEEERARWVGAIRMNIISQMIVLSKAAVAEELEMESPANVEIAKELSADTAEPLEWSDALADKVSKLWADPAIQRIYGERDRLFALNDGAKHFFDNLERIRKADYVPTLQDVLSVRIRSATFEQAIYTYKDTNFRVWDIGGQIPERKKWRKHILASTAIFFFSALTEYDQKLREDASATRLSDTLELFSEICLLEAMKQKTVVLMLNKVDLFKIKVQTKSIRTYFTEYKGSDDWEPSAEYIRKQFLSRANNLTVLTHFVCALDTDMARVIWTATRDILLKKALEAGLGTLM